VLKFEPSRIPETPDPSLFIGYALDDTTMLEIMVRPENPEMLVIYHVMEARPKFIALARRKGRPGPAARREPQK
jgi:hypothetical protein